MNTTPEPDFTERDAVLARVKHSTGELFRANAMGFVLVFLATHGPTPGETITDACREAGIVPEKGDMRGIGPVYTALSKAGKIVTVEFCLRKHGNHTSGGRVWALKD